MHRTSMELGHAFPVRKSKAQKQAFRDAVLSYARELNYSCTVEKGSFGCNNVIIGDPDKAAYLVTAHYDTCAGMLFPNFITPCNVLTYILYQLLMVLWMLLPPAIPGLLVWYFTGSGEAGYVTWYGLFWVSLLLMLFGPANPTNVNDNTSGVVTVLEIMRSLPLNHRENVCFVLFDLEEAGLIGSSSYRKAHKAQTDRQIVLNLDCVGDGDHLMLFPTKKLRKDPGKLEKLQVFRGRFGEKSMDIREKGFSVYPSDQRNFPYGVGICALHKGPLGLYMGRIHTRRDTVLDQTNVNLLRAAISTCLGSAHRKGAST